MRATSVLRPGMRYPFLQPRVRLSGLIVSNSLNLVFHVVNMPGFCLFISLNRSPTNPAHVSGGAELGPGGAAAVSSTLPQWLPVS